jgi:hypothetical protein
VEALQAIAADPQIGGTGHSADVHARNALEALKPVRRVAGAFWRRNGVGRGDGMSDSERYQGSIPGSDPGSCPHCGAWRKAGMIHNCEREGERLSRQLAGGVEALRILADHTEWWLHWYEHEPMPHPVDVLEAAVRAPGARVVPPPRRDGRVSRSV